MQWDAGITDVATAGTQVQIKNTNDAVLWARFKGAPGNTGNTFVGLSDVSSTNGFTLENNDDIGLTLDFRSFGGSVKASTIWVDAATNGDDVVWALIMA